MSFKMCVLAAISIASIAVSQTAVAKKTPKLKFDVTHLELPQKANGPFLTLNSDTNKEWLFSGYENLEKWLIYSQISQQPNDGAFNIDSGIIALPKDALFIDTFLSGQSKQAFVITRTGIAEVQFDTLNTKPILDIKHLYRHGNDAELTRLDFAKDLNNDNKVDFIINDIDGLKIFLSNENGAFTQQLIPITPTSRHFDEGTSLDPRRYYFSDLNNDNNKDLFAIIENKIHVFHFQNGKFNELPQIVALPDILTDESQARFRIGGGQDQSKLSIKRPYRLLDLNNDSILDLVVLETQSEGVFEKQNLYHMHFGSQVDGQLTFNTQANTFISTRGQEFSIEFEDLNNDNLIDIYTSSVEIGFGKIVSALLSGEVDIDVRFFLQTSNQTFPKEPDVEKEAEMEFSLSSGSASFPVVELADFNNDQLVDLLIQDDDDDVRFNAGHSKKLFNRRGRDVDMPLPKDAGRMQVIKLNNDQWNDILISYGNNDSAKKQRRVSLLINRK